MYNNKNNTKKSIKLSTRACIFNEQTCVGIIELFPFVRALLCSGLDRGYGFLLLSCLLLGCVGVAVLLLMVGGTRLTGGAINPLCGTDARAARVRRGLIRACECTADGAANSD